MKKVKLQLKDEKKMYLRWSPEDNLLWWDDIDKPLGSSRDEIDETLCFIWNEYVKADSSNFTESALKLREKMIEYFDEVSE
jgi:hypothetical protein